MADIINSIWRTVSSPFVPFLNALQYRAPQYQAQNQAQNQYIQTQYVPPQSQLNAKASLRQIDPITYDAKWLSGMSDCEAQSRINQIYATQQKKQEFAMGAAQKDVYRQQNLSQANQLQFQNRQSDAQRVAWEQRQNQLLAEPMPGMSITFG